MDSQLVTTLIFLLVMFGVFYLFLIRPERRRRQQHRDLIDSLKRGDKVVTAGGICGIIKKVDKERIWLEVEDGMTLKLVKDSIAERDSRQESAKSDKPEPKESDS